VLAAAIKCKHCGSDISAPTGRQDAPPAAQATTDLVAQIPRRLEKRLALILEPSEVVRVKLRGVFAEALICTDRRVLILKAGYMTGHLFGASIFQTPYRNITSAQVNTHLLSGYFEISAGGVQNVATSYWGTGKNSAAYRDNCVSLNRTMFKRFQSAANYITSMCR
jgi:hypothetical protein